MTDAEVSRYVARIGELEGQLEHANNRIEKLVQHIKSLTTIVKSLTVYLGVELDD
jgi:methyl-accepting chemotaxis protein